MEIAAAPASCIPVPPKSTLVRDDMSRCSPKLETKGVSRLSWTLEHSNKHSQAKLIYDLRSSAELIFLAITIKNDIAVSSLREAMMPLMNKKTCLSLSKYLLSSTTEVKSLSLLITWNARKRPAKNSWKLLCKNAKRVQGLRLAPPCWKDKNPKLISLTVSSSFSKYDSPLRRDSNAKLPKSKSSFL